MSAPVLAVDLGGTRMRAALVSPSGEVARRQVRPTPTAAPGPDALVELMRDVAAGDQPSHAVVGVPGRVDYRGGACEHAPNLPRAWAPLLTAAHLSRAAGLPVHLANDADLAAVGEAYFGAGRGYDDVVYVTLSTGVGAGVLLDRRLCHGRRSLAEAGHHVLDIGADARGEPSTFEQLAAGTAFARFAAAEGSTLSGPALTAAALGGDPAAARAWRRVVVAAAAGVRNLAFLFVPQVVVIGGGLGLVGEPLYAPIRACLAEHGPPHLPQPIAVVGASLGDAAGLAGAGAWERALA